jgi:hypothetical protein
MWMSRFNIPVAQPEISSTEVNPKKEISRSRAIIDSLTAYAFTGAAAGFLLSVIEWVDLNLRSFTFFDSFSDRAIIAVYFSINILAGLLIGLTVGLFARAASRIIHAVEKRFSRTGKTGLALRLITGLSIAAVAAFLLNQQPHINRYVIGLIREAEKFRSLRNYLLNHERSSSYLILFGLIIGCWVIWKITRSAGSLSPVLRAAWLLFLAFIIGVAYYIDSRVEVQLYEYTLHRSMYLLAVLVAMAFAGSLYFSTQKFISRRSLLNPRRRTVMAFYALIALGAAVLFTFFHFGNNQSLKTIVFYQTTQAKQNFKLAWWALDFDRDGYSGLLDGGDIADNQKSINPGRLEALGDGVDNNCIGGELTERDLELWKGSHQISRGASASQPVRFNIIYFFIDTVRADHLSVYGYGRNTTPNIDKLAARASLFEHAFSPAARTSEAVPKFMQSSYWDARLDSWTQVLTQNGYNVMLFPGRRSWERYKDWMPVVKQAQNKPLAANIDVAIETLSNTPPDQPFCAYIYVPDPHRPYVKHEEFDYGNSVVDLYDGELAYTDSQLGKLFDWMEKTGRFDNTMVVIMADHGESLGERGVYRHATQLYNEQTRVPMIVYVPNQTPRRINDFVSTIDLGSTILSAAGVKVPEQYMGVNLLPLIRGEAFTRPPVYAEQTSQEVSPFVRLDQQVHPETKKYMVVTQDGYKLIYNRDFYNFELFDLNSDPAERRNLYDRLPDKARELRTLLGQFVDIVTASRPADADEGRYSKSGGIDGDKVED